MKHFAAKKTDESEGIENKEPEISLVLPLPPQALE